MHDFVSDPDRKGDTPNDTDRMHDQRLTVGTPRWVKVFGTSMIVLVLTFVALHLTGHGFGSHTALSSTARQP